MRKRTVIVFLMSLTTTVAWWGISTWVPPFVAGVAAKAGLPPQTWASYAGMSYNIGAILGYIGLGFLADRVRPQAGGDDLLRRLAGAHASRSICGRPICIC